MGLEREVKMPISRKKKKTLIRLLSILISIILVIGIVGSLIFWIIKEKGNKSESRVEDMKIVWELKSDMLSGDLITKDDIASRYISQNIMEDITLSENEIVGKYLKLHTRKGMVLAQNMVYEGEVLSDDLRIHNYNYIIMTDHIMPGDYIDIRISFQDGNDFILLSKKKVLEASLFNQEENLETSLWLQVTEEEILRLSSAVVDSYLNEGCYIYAIEYVAETQKSAIVNYPVSDVVKRLIESDPNIIKRAENVLEKKVRKELEEELEKQKNKSNNEERNIENSQDSSMYNQDESVFKGEKSSEVIEGLSNLDEIEFMD